MLTEAELQKIFRETVTSLYSYVSRQTNADRELTEDEKNTIRLDLEKIKNSLKLFQISIKKYELKAYEDTEIISGEGYIKYISFLISITYIKHR